MNLNNPTQMLPISAVLANTGANVASSACLADSHLCLFLPLYLYSFYFFLNLCCYSHWLPSLSVFSRAEIQAWPLGTSPLVFHTYLYLCGLLFALFPNTLSGFPPAYLDHSYKTPFLMGMLLGYDTQPPTNPPPPSPQPHFRLDPLCNPQPVSPCPALYSSN